MWASFTGTLPSVIGNMTNLQRLVLYENLLTGPLPTELGRMTRLSRLDLNLKFPNGDNTNGVGPVQCFVFYYSFSQRIDRTAPH